MHLLVSDHKSDIFEIKRILFKQNASSTAPVYSHCHANSLVNGNSVERLTVVWSRFHRALCEILCDPPAAHFSQWINGAIIQAIFMQYCICSFAEFVSDTHRRIPTYHWNRILTIVYCLKSHVKSHVLVHIMNKITFIVWPKSI